MDPVAFADVAAANLVIDRVHEGGRSGNAGDDPINRILAVGNSGGFRRRGALKAPEVLVLYTSGAEPDWPDTLDKVDGVFVYYGDNRHPGRALHNTSKQGNLLLSWMFEASGSEAGRSAVPPILLFEKAGRGRDVYFRGLLVPGAPTVPVDEQLVAIWRSDGGSRFQNYRATFSVLDSGELSRAWLDDILAGDPASPNAPQPWLEWRKSGQPKRLMAPRSVAFRSREAQLPKSAGDLLMLGMIHQHFSADPYEFEGFAAALWSRIAPASYGTEVTRRSRDGGRDAVGHYRIGPLSDPIKLEFALEAKCYEPLKAVGVKEVSRLISRLRHRQFGVLVTTSYVHRQAYEEVRLDEHPVVIVSGGDIIATLRDGGLASPERLRAWLATDYPIHPKLEAAFPPASSVGIEWSEDARA